MKIVSTNISKPKTVIWQGKEVETGMYKKPVHHSLFLGNTDVKDDAVIDRKYHGGLDKACYLYSEDNYPFWKEKYPNVGWEYGVFGENLTVNDCNESSVYIGDVFEVGTSIIQVSQPRQPCFKLGIRFNDQGILKEFIKQPFPGIYFRVIKEGEVKTGDDFKLVERVDNGVSVAEVYKTLYDKSYGINMYKKVLNQLALAESCKETIQKKYQ